MRELEDGTYSEYENIKSCTHMEGDMKNKFMDFFKKGTNKPIEIKFTTSERGVTNLLNIDFDGDKIIRRKGWKTFKSMVNELNKLNRKYKKMGITGDFTIRLPIKGNK